MREKIKLEKRAKHFSQIHTWGLMVVPPLGAVLALSMFLQGQVGFLEIGLFLLMYLISIIGITVGFHRLFAHGAFQTSPQVRGMLAIFGSMSCQGPIIYWVSNHRRHHQHSDQPGDPHSPHFKDEHSLPKWKGFLHAHSGWIFRHELSNSFVFSKDLLKDPVVSKVNQFYLFWMILGLAIPALLGGIATGSLSGLYSGFIWGGLVRIFLFSHMSYCINSICHLYGQRPFETKEYSTNNFWLAIPTGGESWHNNHHAFPTSAKFGLTRQQFDLGYQIIRLLESLNLVWKVKSPTADMIAKKRG